jgi:hypothetical protein
LKNHRLPPERGAGPTTPPPRPHRRPRGKRVPGSPLWGAKKDIMVWGIFGGRREVSEVVESDEL